MGFISNDRKQIDLLGYCLDDFVSKDAKCRFVVDLLSRLDLRLLYDQYSAKGADAFDPSTMLATWFFGYSEGEISTRKLEDKCNRDLHYIYVSANLRPDHSSLSRFRKDNLELLNNYFVQLVQLAEAEGLSDFSHLSIDGSKVEACCSIKQSKTSEGLAKEAAAIRRDIEVYMEHCDLAEINDLPEENIENIREKISQLQELEKTYKERQYQLEERKQTIKPEHRDKHQINLVEPDAFMMSRVNGNKKRPGYNSQIATDTKTGFIVANDVVQDRNDKKQFSKQYKNINTNLSYNPQREYDLDAGYFSLDQVKFAFDNNIDAVIADPNSTFCTNSSDIPTVEEILKKNRAVTKSDFRFHEQENYYECPSGRKLRHVGQKNDSKTLIDLYQSESCEDCLLRSRCLSNKNKSGRRTTRRDKREVYAEQMREKLKTQYAKERLKSRAMTVEPVFGNLKENLGFRRFRLGCIGNVKAEFNLMCIGHNINILFNFMKNKKKSIMIAAKKVEDIVIEKLELLFLFVLKYIWSLSSIVVKKIG